MGNLARAREFATRVESLSRHPIARFVSAYVFALEGNFRRAVAIADELARAHPTVRMIQSVHLPALRAMIELERGNAAGALELLEPLRPYEAAETLPIIVFGGRAYLELGQPREAAAEFEKIVKNRGQAFGGPLYPLAHLWLGRAHGAAGDAAQARKHYQDFLALWKDADADIPLLREAKAEYDKLR